jgi:hypothetical protein
VNFFEEASGNMMRKIHSIVANSLSGGTLAESLIVLGR